MDLLQILQKIWRYRIVTLPVLALTLLGAIYVVALKESEYSAPSSYVLINPPAPPTAEEIAADPSLGRLNSDNPFTRFTDQSVVMDLLASTLSNESARRALAQQGADNRYTVAPSSEFGFSSQLLDVTGVGSTPREAVQTAELVGAALTSELDRLQASRGVDARYMIETQRVAAPDRAVQRVSGKLRALVGVFAMGAILLFVVISAADALTTLRAERSKQGVPKDKQGSSEGAGTNISRLRQWLRGLRGAGHKEEPIEEKDKQGSIEGGTNNQPAHLWQRSPRGAGSRVAVPKEKDKEEPIEEKDKQGSIEGGTNNQPAHLWQRSPRGAGSRVAVPKEKDKEEPIEEKDKQGSIEGGTNNQPAHLWQRSPRGAGSRVAVPREKDEEEPIEVKGKQESIEGVGTNNSPPREQRRRDRRAASKKAAPKKKEGEVSTEGAGTNNSPPRERRRRDRRAASKKAAPKKKEGKVSTEGAGTNNSPPRERRRRDRRAASKKAAPKKKEGEVSIEGAGTNNSPAHLKQRGPRGAGSKA